MRRCGASSIRQSVQANNPVDCLIAEDNAADGFENKLEFLSYFLTVTYIRSGAEKPNSSMDCDRIACTAAIILMVLPFLASSSMASILVS